MPVPLAVALGGALGALGRYGVDRLIERRSVAVFPWSTFAINVGGCLVIGALIAALVDRHHTPAWLRLGLTMGLIGGFTTFSTYAQETLDLLEEGHAGIALTNALGSVAAGVTAVIVGLRVGRVL